MNSKQVHEQLLKELTNERKKLIKEITNALTYKKSGDRVGGMAMCKIVNTLNGTYGSDSMDTLLKKASIAELHKAHKLLDDWRFIELGKTRAREIKSGVKFCPHCGERI